MKYKTQSLTQYLKDLSAKLPAPGGGSAAAFTAAMGSALLSMVVNFTLGKPKYARFEKELTLILSKTEAFRKEFLELVDADVAAYRSKNIRKALAVPLKVARLCIRALDLCLPLAKKGNVNLVSDVAVAADLLESAFSAAAFNVRINLKNLGDQKLTQKTRQELERMHKIAREIRKDTEERVGKVIRG